MERKLESVDEVSAFAKELLQGLRPKADRATLITLSGELGAGKTTLTQAIAKHLGVEEHVTSPTFVLMKIYALPEEAPFRRLVHIDAYRLSGGKDLAPLGLDEILQDASNLVLIEWPEQVEDGLESADQHVSIRVHEDATRTVTYGS